MCIQLLRFAAFRSCCQQAHGHKHMVILSLSPVKNRLGSEFCNFCIEFCKMPSHLTFLMQVFAGLCTGKVTLSYWMLQNTGQNVQEIDVAKCIGVI